MAGNICRSYFYLSSEYANLVTLPLDWKLFFFASRLHLCHTVFILLLRVFFESSPLNCVQRRSFLRCTPDCDHAASAKVLIKSTLLNRLVVRKKYDWFNYIKHSYDFIASFHWNNEIKSYHVKNAVDLRMFTAYDSRCYNNILMWTSQKLNAQIYFGIRTKKKLSRNTIVKQTIFYSHL